MDWRKKLQQEPRKTVLIDEFLADCCHELGVTAGEVKDEFLSADDQQMILAGKYSSGLVTAHIKAWIKSGKSL